MIATVWLTHGHHDHIDALVEVVEATGVEAAICPADLKLAGSTARCIGQRLIAGGQVRVGEQSFDVRATGGHTAGGVSLFIPGAPPLLAMRCSRVHSVAPENALTMAVRRQPLHGRYCHKPERRRSTRDMARRQPSLKKWLATRSLSELRSGSSHSR